MQYAIAICPPPHIVDYVKKYKLLLKRHAGWYPSVHSKAHITMTSFTANSWQLENACWFTKDYCARRGGLSVLFNEFGAYANGALFLAPGVASRRVLTPLMKDFARKFPVRAISSTDPHMSIGRGLDQKEIIRAVMLFAKMPPQLSFPVEGLSLRRLDERRGQYDIIAHFPFSSDASLDTYCWQGSLF